MTASVQPIAIEGLKEFQKALKNMDGESQKKLRVAPGPIVAAGSQGGRRR